MMKANLMNKNVFELVLLFIFPTLQFQFSSQTFKENPPREVHTFLKQRNKSKLLKKLIANNPLRQLSRNGKNGLWLFRLEYTQLPQMLPYVLQSVDYYNPQDGAEIPGLYLLNVLILLKVFSNHLYKELA